jgi:hypothetical protein
VVVGRELCRRFKLPIRSFCNVRCVLQCPQRGVANKRKKSLTILQPLGSILLSVLEYNEGRTWYVRVHGLYNVVAWLLGW